jgi:hypothetical protein
MAARPETNEDERDEINTSQFCQLPEDKKVRKITLVCGKTRLGKSWLVKHGLLKKMNRVIICDPMNEYVDAIRIDDMQQMATYCLSHKVFRVRTTLIRNFNDVCYIAACCGECTILIEESQRFLANKAALTPMMDYALFQGGHHAISVLLVMQRAYKVNIDIRSQWTEIYSFRQSEERDISWFQETSGFDIEEIRNLGIGEYYYLTNSEEKLIKKN